ncbi:restriction endonuclease subunit S [Leucothrix pacifica]|uniref:Restriction endonuclease subunit S n=1 Tax=Leucothrix pacifica TaxID=1247513 RepID=A0A317CJ39_9GAMM|nr:restriction endonuclease subunit S [Leucothrix pacifica]PWQ98201.1 restriction endonuclease subunit S [Leucothrix pacifica]
MSIIGPSKKYQAYHLYKESGVERLKTIPSHWYLTRVKYIAEITPRKPSVDRSLNCSFVAMEKLKTDSLVLDEVRQIDAVYDGYTYFAENDILMAKVTPCFENKNIAIAKGLTNEIGFGSSEIYTIRATKTVHNRFLFYRLQEDGFMDLAIGAMTGAGGLKRVPSEILANYPYASPDYVEQETIANFLDHETAKIDTLIEKQQQLIKLLKEKRQAVISHAVTKGLNPDVTMRDSGVEWLGEVPEHWVVTKVKYKAELTPKKTEVELHKRKQCSFIPMEKLKKDLLLLDEVKNISDVFDGYTYFRDEDLLLAKVTPCFENKNMVVARGLVNGIGFGSSEIYVLRVPESGLNDFLYYRLQEDVFMEMATGAMTGAGGLKRVPADFLVNFQLALPPEEERSEIIKHIKKLTARIDELECQSNKAIELLQERRTALISAAVTGKIDVRNWQPTKPASNEAEEVVA